MHPYFDNNNNNNNDNSLLHYVSNIGIIILQETLMVKRRYMYCTCECVGEYMFGR